MGSNHPTLLNIHKQ